MKRTTIFLGDQDRDAIQRIQDRYGVSTDSDAIRLALRVLAEAKEIGLSPLPQNCTTSGDRTARKR
jgi:Arc/MetJ family transcription regulator